MTEVLDRAKIPYEETNWMVEKTVVTIGRPFSPRFSYWAGLNNKVLYQTSRIDKEAAEAYLNGQAFGIEFRGLIASDECLRLARSLSAALEYSTFHIEEQR